jgi:Arc/MetJ-type ribon-helix-helix transcriptional regulator
LYGTMYGMVKTTVYLSEDLKAALERAASEEHRSEADLIREAIRARVDRQVRARPRVPLVERSLGDPTAAERVDDLLSGFGAS